MEWPEALEIVVARTRHEAYRKGCADGHPERETWRARMVAMASGLPPTPPRQPEYPPLARQAANLAASFWSWAVSGFSVATGEEQARRLAICQACPQYDATATRCRVCGCYLAAKVAMKAEHCPLSEPKW